MSEERTVSNSYSDDELLKRAVRGVRPHLNRPMLRWACVADAFALGSTFSAQLCRRFGLDPDEYIKPPPRTVS